MHGTKTSKAVGDDTACCPLAPVLDGQRPQPRLVNTRTTLHDTGWARSTAQQLHTQQPAMRAAAMRTVGSRQNPGTALEAALGTPLTWCTRTPPPGPSALLQLCPLPWRRRHAASTEVGAGQMLRVRAGQGAHLIPHQHSAVEGMAYLLALPHPTPQACTHLQQQARHGLSVRQRSKVQGCALEGGVPHSGARAPAERAGQAAGRCSEEVVGEQAVCSAPQLTRCPSNAALPALCCNRCCSNSCAHLTWPAAQPRWHHGQTAWRQ